MPQRRRHRPRQDIARDQGRRAGNRHGRPVPVVEPDMVEHAVPEGVRPADPADALGQAPRRAVRPRVAPEPRPPDGRPRLVSWHRQVQRRALGQHVDECAEGRGPAPLQRADRRQDGSPCHDIRRGAQDIPQEVHGEGHRDEGARPGSKAAVYHDDERVWA